MWSRYRSLKEKWTQKKAALKAQNRWVYWLVELVELVVVAGSAALLIRTFVAMVSVVPTGSMIPTLMIGDRLIVDRVTYRFRDPVRGEIVVFQSVVDDKDYVKRLVGMPGETIRIVNGIVYANQKEVFFPGVNVQQDDPRSEIATMGPYVIPAGHYFMMGDNRNNSRDSRFWGTVPRRNIFGKAWFTFWPFNRMQRLH